MASKNPDSRRISFSWRAPDGEIFSGEKWNPLEAARAKLICVHGLGGAATDFVPLGEMAVASGFSVIAPNLRGQGCDPKPQRRGRFLDPEVLIEDLAALLRSCHEESPEVPVFLCGESLGALLVASLLGRASFAFPIRGAIFSVPVVDLKNPTPPAVRLALRVFARLFPKLRLDPSRFVSRKIGARMRLQVTRDVEYEEFLQNAPHRIPVFSLAVLNAVGDLMDSRAALAAGVRVPALVLAAGQDVYVHPRQLRSWFKQLSSPDKEFCEYPEAFHLLWNDDDREEVLRDIGDWLERKLYK